MGSSSLVIASGAAPDSQGIEGLTSAEASARLARFGPNALASRQRFTILRQALRFFTNPLVIILLLASGVSASLGEATSAIIIFVIVALSVAIDTFQTARSQQAAETLRRSVALTATVLRDGAWGEIERRAIVPGDIIRLSAGDLVPADATLLESHDVYAQEAALTGESLPTEKHAAGPAPTPPGADAAQPTPEQRVYLGSSIISGAAIARVTATGRATEFGEIAERLRARAPETEFERGLRGFGMLILRTVFFLTLFVFLVNLVARRDPLESLLFAVALAVGLTPEFLPMITTVTLTRGAVHMAKQHVVVKHLEAIQNFGGIDILCSDKTGTLTSGEMTLGASLDALGAASDRAEELAAINSRLESGIRSPLDAAILRAVEAKPALQAASESAVKVDEIPFDFERRRLSVVADVGGARLLITKGAPESMLPLCVAYETDGASAPLDEQARAAVEAVFAERNARGERALAVAMRAAPGQTRFTAADERDLTLVGFVCFADQPLPDAAEALTALASDGVRVKILTGDNELVARHVCAAVGLDASQLVRGAEIDRMTDAALGQVAERAIVFARVSPAQKNRIILALKRRGHVVGFLGDGVNDAPSLHAADVGVSVATAVDVAKDSAEIILMRPGLSVLHNGILEGRKAFGNVMKYLLMGTSSNFGNMFSMAAATIFLPYLPMLPSQILLNNLLYDLAQISIPTDNVDASYIRKPHRWDIRAIRNFMLLIGPISSVFDFLTFFLLLRVFHAPETLFHTGWFVESLATQTLVLFVIRTAGNPFKSRPSRPLVVTTLAIVALAMALPFTPLAAPLGFTPLPFALLALIAAMTVVYLALVNVLKRPLMRERAGNQPAGALAGSLAGAWGRWRKTLQRPHSG
ncbi:MAG TPA: magnesium-translocating P-type ATPase [Ktedonobacterales bacterium]